jgi:hypothetical protein
MTARGMLKLAGIMSASIALLHVAVIFFGGPAYRYFGAGEEMARLAEAGSPVPALITAGITVVFALWATYAFSGAGVIGRLPLLRVGLVTIGAIYTARGLLLGPQAAWFLSALREAVPPRQLAFSGASLAIGLVYLVGTSRAWAQLRPSRGNEPSGSALRRPGAGAS